jgi:phage tail sheath protein FI
MSTLVSAGVSVTVTDESFYIPAAAPTVPLFFVATRAGKTQPNGITAAAGTNEHSVVRTVTSIGQSIQLFGVPNFRTGISGNPLHGDSRNEYGLFALNQFLGIGNRAFVVRANVDLADDLTTFVSAGVPVASNITLTGAGNGLMTSVSTTSNKIKPQSIVVTMTSATTFNVVGSVSGNIGSGTVGTPFTSLVVNFTINAGADAFETDDIFEFDLVYAPTTYNGSGNGTMSDIVLSDNAIAETWTITFTSDTAFDVVGSVSGEYDSGEVGVDYDNGLISFIIRQGTITPFSSGEVITLALSNTTVTDPLGATAAEKRAKIVTALQAAINSNTEIRSETYEYNLIVCPGYPEVVDEMVALSSDIADEAFVIADVPSDKDPDEAATWAMTSSRVRSVNVAYYYPWGLASNLDGAEVVVAPSGIALRTFAYSDNQSYVWFAPAGVNRGLVTGVARVGYVKSGVFYETNLNQGQRDNLYEFFKNINPIVFFPGRGIIIWGQKTSSPSASALDRINVAREMCYIRRQLRKGSFPYLFEPNDSITRENLKSSADGFLNDILAKRGLEDFVTLCDTSNNTPDRIARNEMYLDVGVRPTKSAEFIYIPIRVLSAGSQSA